MSPEPSKTSDLRRFADLTFDDFRRLATDDSLSRYEKIGFPDSYREGHEEAILADIVAKLPALEEPRRRVLDIGPGCSDLPRMLIDLCGRGGHELVLVDSPEMLDQLPDEPFVRKLPGAFPEAVGADAEPVDAILAYSVLHYVFGAGDVFGFLDRAMELLAHGGRMLIGDIPNVSKRRRFFSSPTGVAFHHEYMRTEEPPEVEFNRVEHGTIDDAVVLGLVMRARAAGCDAYVVPQPPELPMANRREDLLVVRP